MAQSKDISLDFELEDKTEKQRIKDRRIKRQQQQLENNSLSTTTQSDTNFIGKDIHEDLIRVAMDIFGEQANISSNSSEVTSEKLQLSKARSDNFLASVSGIIEMSNKIELLQAQQYKFKRHDELRLLNNLREQYEKAAKFSNTVMNTCLNKMEDLQYNIMENQGTIDDEILMEIGALSNMMDNAVVSLRNISKGSTELLKAERETGGRSHGGNNNSNNGGVYNNLYLSSLKGTNQDNEKTKAERIRDNYKGEIRKLTAQQLLELNNE